MGSFTIKSIFTVRRPTKFQTFDEKKIRAFYRFDIEQKGNRDFSYVFFFHPNYSTLYVVPKQNIHTRVLVQNELKSNENVYLKPIAKWQTWLQWTVEGNFKMSYTNKIRCAGTTILSMAKVEKYYIIYSITNLWTSLACSFSKQQQEKSKERKKYISKVYVPP